MTWCLAKLSSERLPPTADGSRFIDTQPNIRQRAHVGVLDKPMDEGEEELWKPEGLKTMGD